MIRKIWADNYKSLKNFQLELGGFNVLIGANASGKSNIIDVLSFIQDSLSSPDGVIGAVSRREAWPGPETGTNFVTIGFSQSMSAETLERALAPLPLAAHTSLEDNQFDYELTLASRGHGIEVVQERMGELSESGIRLPAVLQRNDLGAVFQQAVADGASAPTLLNGRVPLNRLALGYPVSPLTVLADLVLRWRFLDLNALAMRRSAMSGSSVKLQRDGGNLAQVLLALKEHGWKDDVRDALRRDVPGFVDFDAYEIRGQVFLTVQEDTTKDLPASAISDGTLRLLAFYAVYYSENWPPLLCVEEPENGLHPDLVESLVDYFRSMSEHCQVIVTTHSSMLVDQCKPEEVVLLEKVEGRTRAVRTSERAHITEFLKNFSLGDLWTRKYLDEAA